MPSFSGIHSKYERPVAQAGELLPRLVLEIFRRFGQAINVPGRCFEKIQVRLGNDPLRDPLKLGLESAFLCDPLGKPGCQ